jgi:hypothetical protein
MDSWEVCSYSPIPLAHSGCYKAKEYLDVEIKDEFELLFMIKQDTKLDEMHKSFEPL